MLTSLNNAHKPGSRAVSCRALARQYAQSDYQLDVFPTGQGGAAFCLRYGVPGDYRIMVYDGGTAATGNDIVEHIRTQYHTETIHDLICSHPCATLAVGLAPIMEHLDVQHFWMHRPWIHSRTLAQYFSSNCGLDSDFAKFTEYTGDKLALTFALEEMALEREIRISEPFQGKQVGPMTVMSPHRDWYIHRLLPDFLSPPPVKRRVSPELARILRMLGIQDEDTETVDNADTGDVNKLSERGAASAEMESSVVLHGLIGGHGVMLTGNAGIKALSNAAAYAERERMLVPSSLRFLQVPNQGDANHLSSSVLDRLAGAARSALMAHPGLIAHVSTSYGHREYPHRAVSKALHERGVTIVHAKDRSCASYRYDLREQSSLVIAPSPSEPSHD